MKREYVIAALYKFVNLEDYETMRGPLKKLCDNAGLQGTLLLAQEGINGTVAGTREGIEQLLSHLKADLRLADLEHKESYCKGMPFYRMKVRLKKEIVALGVAGVNPCKKVGRYIEPEDWNELIENPEVTTIDTRNDYESAIGVFKGAVIPKTKAFREFPDFVKKNLDPNKHKKVAMFCTGGIRCEKSTSYLLELGFEEVYHLKGGILKYLEKIPKENSLWEGECFVFDQRVGVKHGLEEGRYELCHGCRFPVTETDKASEYYKAGIYCPHCYGKRSVEQMHRSEERQKQIDLCKQRGNVHLGSF